MKPQDIETLTALRPLIRGKSCQAVFARIAYSDDDGTYVQVTKAATLRALPPEGQVKARVRENETDAIYIG